MKIFSKLLQHKQSAQLKLQAKAIERLNANWDGYIEQYPKAEWKPIHYYIKNHSKAPFNQPGFFDTSYYLHVNPDVRAHDIPPLLHYALHGKNEQRPATKDTHYRLVLSDFRVDWNRYAEEYKLPNRASCINHYMLSDGQYGPVIPDTFDTDTYLRLYPDIQDSGFLPAVHFLIHGEREGRTGWIDIDKICPANKENINSGHPYLLLFVHETSQTGAPLLGFEITKKLNSDFNIIVITKKQGAIFEDFCEHAAGVLSEDSLDPAGPQIETIISTLHSRNPFSAIVANSVETFSLIAAASSLNIPTVSLIHEYAEYTRPQGKIASTILASDIVVYPAESVAQSGLRDLRLSSNIKPRPSHIKIRPQGALSAHRGQGLNLKEYLKIPESEILICGAGYVQPRKGVDWFVETAHMTLKARPKVKLHFAWIGAGWHPDDLIIGAWLKTYIEKHGLEQDIHFIEEVDNFPSTIASADIFLLTSKLDPFPNVAIDALGADCGMGCFDGASGISEILSDNTSRGVIAQYGDTRELANLLIQNLSWLAGKTGENKSLVRAKLNMDSYMEDLKQFISEATLKKSHASQVANHPANRKRIDENFFATPVPKGRTPAEYFYSLLDRNICIFKPFPGAIINVDPSTGRYPTLPERSEREVPLEHDTNTILLKEEYQFSSFPHLKVAIHLHAFHQDQVALYLDHFDALKLAKPHLFITHTSDLRPETLGRLKHLSPEKVTLLRLDNSGRNIRPFHIVFKRYICGRFDVVGHFHTKKSTHSGPDLGARWAQYLLDNLVGDENISCQILELFKEKRLGLVYAEDGHIMDEGSNLQEISRLCEKLSITPQPTDFSSFPLGASFWARTEALQSLTDISDGFFAINEPVPYDGSALHAFERVLPHLVRSAEYLALKVYRPNTSW